MNTPVLPLQSIDSFRMPKTLLGFSLDSSRELKNISRAGSDYLDFVVFFCMFVCFSFLFEIRTAVEKCFKILYDSLSIL